MIEARAVHDRRNLVIAYGSEVARPLLRSLARLRAHGPPTPPATWRRVVILGVSHMGDVLNRTASLEMLRRALPQAHIAYVCEPGVADLLETNPHLDEVLPIHDERARPWSPLVWSTLQAKRFDAALCTNHFMYHAELALVTALGIPNRVAFVHKGFSGLATRPLPAHFPQLSPAYFRSMVAALGGVAPDWPLEPVLYLTAEDRDEADAAMRELALDDRRALIACTMSVRQDRTLVWPPDRYLAALERLGSQLPLQVVLCGSKSDAPFLEDVAARAPFPCRVMAGRLRLRALAVFLSRCDALLAADSGPRHIANAVGTPVVFIRSLSACRAESGRYCANEVDVAPDGDYLSLEAQAAALARIDPATVARALGESLAARPRPGVV
jgi:heptosyltransferase-1